MEMRLRRTAAIVAAAAVVWFVVLARFEGVDCQSVTLDPVNVGAAIGDQDIIINCTVIGRAGAPFAWEVLKSSLTTGAPVYSYSDSGGDSYPQGSGQGNYTVNRYSGTASGEEHFDLVIKQVTDALAGTYKASLFGGISDTSNLIVLGNLQCPVEGDEYTEGMSVNISCSVNYNNYNQLTLKPDLSWWDDSQEDTNSEYIVDTSTRRTLSLNRTLTAADDEMPFTCHLNFQSPPNPSNPPTYDDNCTTHFLVRHVVTEVTIYPYSDSNSPKTILVGDVLNCTANGRPAPTIVWYNENRVILSEDDELDMTSEMSRWGQPVTFICIANNSIDGIEYVDVEANVTFYVDGVPQAQTASVEPWVIAVAVVVPIVVIAIAAVAGFLIYRHRKKKTTKKKTPAKTNGSSAPPNNGTYSAVPMTAPPGRPPPSSVPRTNTGSTSSQRGPPGPDSRTGGTDSPGFGDLGVRTYGGSNQAMNAYPGNPNSSLRGSNSGLGGGVSMNPEGRGGQPSYPIRGSNNALNTAGVSANPKPQYPYQGSNPVLNTSQHSGNPNLAGYGVVGAGVGRQPSVASSSSRSTSYNNQGVPPAESSRYNNDLGSMHGSEV